MPTATNTVGLLALAADAKKHRTNRQATPRLVDDIDPDGTHILVFSMIHNDVEFRTLWMVKMRGSMEPLQIFLDVTFEAFTAFTTEIPNTTSRTVGVA